MFYNILEIGLLNASVLWQTKSGKTINRKQDMILLAQQLCQIYQNQRRQSLVKTPELQISLLSKPKRKRCSVYETRSAKCRKTAVEYCHTCKQAICNNHIVKIFSCMQCHELKNPPAPHYNQYIPETN